MRRLAKLLTWTFLVTLCFGFRVFPEKWDISKSDPTIWIKFCDTNYSIEENDLESGDQLAGISGLTFNQVVQSIIDDYNNIPTSFLRLALYPSDPNNPGSPVAGDSAFTIEKASQRTIEICFGGTDAAAGVSGGHAKPTFEGRKIVRCEIKAKPEHTKKAKFLTHLLAHELGHCFGLEHPQESTNSVMSYFGNAIPRLGNDDASGITFGYPEEEAYGSESYTLGLTGCSPK